MTDLPASPFTANVERNMLCSPNFLTAMPRSSTSGFNHGLSTRTPLVREVREISGRVPYSILKKDPQIAEELMRFAKAFDASFVAFQVHNHTLDRHVVFTTGYEKFYEKLVDRDIFQVDPIMAECRSRRTAFEWDALLETGSSAALDETFTVGRNRISIPVPHNDFSVALHFASNHSEDEWRAMIVDVIWTGTMIAAQNFQRVLRTRPTETKEISLSRFQRECLSLLAAGKDLEEIAALTGRRQKRVHKRVDEALTALNANNHPHAIVMARFLNLI